MSNPFTGIYKASRDIRDVGRLIREITTVEKNISTMAGTTTSMGHQAKAVHYRYASADYNAEAAAIRGQGNIHRAIRYRDDMAYASEKHSQDQANASAMNYNPSQAQYTQQVNTLRHQLEDVQDHIAAEKAQHDRLENRHGIFARKGKVSRLEQEMGDNQAEEQRLQAELATLTGSKPANDAGQSNATGAADVYKNLHASHPANPQRETELFYDAMLRANLENDPAKQKLILAQAMAHLDNLSSTPGGMVDQMPTMRVPLNTEPRIFHEIHHAPDTAESIMKRTSAEFSRRYHLGNSVSPEAIDATRKELTQGSQSSVPAPGQGPAAPGATVQNNETSGAPGANGAAPAATPPARLSVSASDGSDATIYDKVTGAPKISTNQVKEIQTFLKAQGYDLGQHRDGGVDGNWGKDTQAAFVDACQKLGIRDVSAVDFKAGNDAFMAKLNAKLQADVAARTGTGPSNPAPATPAVDAVTRTNLDIDATKELMVMAKGDASRVPATMSAAAMRAELRKSHFANVSGFPQDALYSDATKSQGNGAEWTKAELAALGTMYKEDAAKHPKLDELLKDEGIARGPAAAPSDQALKNSTAANDRTASSGHDIVAHTDARHNLLVAISKDLTFDQNPPPVTDKENFDKAVVSQLETGINKWSVMTHVTTNGDGEIQRSEMIDIANNRLIMNKMNDDAKSKFDLLLAQENITKVAGVYTDGQNKSGDDINMQSAGTRQVATGQGVVAN